MLLEGLVDKLARNLAWYPPPPSYTLQHHGDGDRELYIQPLQSGLKKVVRAEVELVPCDSIASAIVVVHIAAPAPARFTLLHSHGNAVDLGVMLPFYEQLARALRCNVAAYDYSGYGCSPGAPGQVAASANLGTVYRWVLERHGRQPRDVVLFGQSIGTGPTLRLAARLPELAGVVLHSPFLSGMRVLKPGWRFWPSWLDIFPNYKIAPLVEAPTLVMHGTNDQVVGVLQGRTLHALLQRPVEPLFCTGYTHNNLESSPEYLPRLRRFLAEECFGDEYRAHAGVTS